MGLYNFKPRFEEPILSGRKRHTIRAERKYPDKPGDTMHLYIGLRHPGARLLMRAPCVKVEPITISYLKTVIVAGVRLDSSECEALAKADGFRNFAEMMSFWDGRRPFSGFIFHWDFEAKR